MNEKIKGGGSCEEKEHNKINNFNDSSTLFYSTPTNNLC
jgi:hypothetical protein